MLNLKERVNKQTKTPFWKKRIENDIAVLRKDVSKLERKQRNELRNKRGIERIESRYNVKKKGIKVVIEELKQRIVAKAGKIKRYTNRNEQFRQNRMFLTDQGKVYKELDGRNKTEVIIPDAEEAKKFWTDIWGTPVDHNGSAEWLENVKIDLSNNHQDEMNITMEQLKNQLRKVSNWKAPGPDGVQGFWMKKITNLHERMITQLNNIMQTGEVPKWMTVGRTVLCVKDESIGNAADNFRPISCLPIMWKILTGVLSDNIYNYVETNGLFPSEQKGCKRKSRGTKDQLLIDKLIIQNCKRRKTNLSVAWIDYRKAYDMVPHSWIIECLKMIGVSENIITLIKNSMKNWETILTAGNEELGNVKIERGIFQGDSLSPLLFIICLIPLSLILRKCQAKYNLGKNKPDINHLLFMDDLKLFAKSENEIDTLVNTVHIFSQDIGMEFGVKKCGVVSLKRGKLIKSNGIELPTGEKIKNVDEDGYKYLGVIEIDQIKQKEMKELLRKEYFRRISKVLKSNLNGKNVITAMNTWGVAVLRYGAGIINWNKD